MRTMVVAASLCAAACSTTMAQAAGANAFDGSWNEIVTGESPSCAGSISTTFQVTNGRITQGGYDNGVISPNGTAHGGFGSLTWQGRFVGGKASGKYQRTDGCIGRWEAVRQ